MADFPSTGLAQSLHLNLARLTVLRRLTIRTSPFSRPTIAAELPLRVLPTITSPAFCELLFERNGPPLPFDALFLGWSHEEEFDKFLEEWFSERQDFKVIFRSGSRWESMNTERHVRENLPSTAARERLRFEASYD